MSTLEPVKPFSNLYNAFEWMHNNFTNHDNDTQYQVQLRSEEDIEESILED